MRSLVAAVVLVSAWAVPAQADPAHDPTVFCSTYSRLATVIAYAGYATAPTSHGNPPIALTVTCKYTGDNGTFTGSNTAPGPVTTTAGSALIGFGAVTVCGSARALYADGHVGVAPERCNVIPAIPNPGPVPIPDEEVADPEAPVCAFQRVRPAQTDVAGFVLVAIARAPVRTVPAMASGLTCALNLTNGHVVSATSNQPGPLGVLAQYVAAPYVTVGTKCTSFVVNFLSGPSFTDSRCEEV